MLHQANSPAAQLPAAPQAVYTQALSYARLQRFKPARVLFRRVLCATAPEGSQSESEEHEAAVRAKEEEGACCRPLRQKAWISLAMMEKRAGALNLEDRFARCREVLQRALQEDPQAAFITQAWGLMELQRGNWLAALILLERAVNLEPTLGNVLQWSQVAYAREAVGARRKPHAIQSKSPHGLWGAHCGPLNLHTEMLAFDHSQQVLTAGSLPPQPPAYNSAVC